MAKGFTFEDNSDKVKKALRQVSGQALEEAALLVEAQAKAMAPVDSGELRDKIDHTVKDQDGMKVAQIGSPLQYAIYVEYGKKPVPYKNRAKSVNIFLLSCI